MMALFLARFSIGFAILAIVASPSRVSAEGSCQATNGFNGASTPLYYKATHPTLNSDHIADLPGFTRSVYERDHALIAPESHVYSPMDGWTNSLGAILVTPAMGAQFVMYIAKMGSNGSAGPPMLPGATQRLVFVLGGEAEVKTKEVDLTVAVDHFVYFPPAHPHTLTAGDQGCTIVVIERIFEAWPDGALPTVQHGVASDRPVLPVPGEVFALRKLLPTAPPFDFNIHVRGQPGRNEIRKGLLYVYCTAQRSRSKNNSVNGGSDLLVNSFPDRIFDLEQGKYITFFVNGGLGLLMNPFYDRIFDWNKKYGLTKSSLLWFWVGVQIMDFEPGEFLNVKEIHYNQHVLLMLEGQGIYRLSDRWYPVEAGDVIWMPPFVTQWYGALGKSRSRYFLYKDVNRNPLLG